MDCWPELKGFLEKKGTLARGVLLGLDFDGTLTPLVAHPSLAKLPVRTRRVLARLARQAAAKVAIVSGRSLKDIKARVGLPGLYYAGNHGLEISGPRLSWSHPKARAAAKQLAVLHRQLEREMNHRRGMIIENKGLTLSVHYRGMSEAAAKPLFGEIKRVLARFDHHFLIAPGKKVWEIRPRLNWNKGNALLAVAKSLKGRRLMIFVGDDRPDEDGFKTLGRRCLGIKVGGRSKNARYFLEHPAEVLRFIEVLCRNLP